MSDRDALLDLQSRWTAVGVETEMFGKLVPSLQRAYAPTTWVMSRKRWQIGTMPPEALRVFADWIQEGETTT